MEMAAIGGLAQLGGGLIGANSEANAREEAMRLIQQSVNDLKAVGLPTEEAMRLSLERYKSAGVLTPEMEQDILQGRTEMEGISTDPRLQDAQMASLDELRRIGEGGGVRLSDKAALEGELGNIDAQERGSREAILLDAAQRGGATGGASLASQMLNQQEASGRAHQAGLYTAGKAEDAALQAILQSGQLAGDIRQQSFGEQEKIKSAQDLINQMNTQARRDVQQRNVGQGNFAQEYNLGRQQDIMNKNVDTANTEQTYNRSLPQQMYENEMNRAGALANARSGQATATIQGGQRAADMWSKTGAGLGQIGIGYAQDATDREERQKDRDAGIRTR